MPTRITRIGLTFYEKKPDEKETFIKYILLLKIILYLHLFYILCRSGLCTEQLISLRSLAAYIAQRCKSAIRYTNVNGIVYFLITNE